MAEFALGDWTFEAWFVQVEVACPRRQRVDVPPTGQGRFVIEPSGPSGTYDMTLFGRGDGDLYVTFRWTTPRDGPMPVPEGRLAVLADHGGEVDSDGVELDLSGLVTTPASATAEITVTAANGRSLTFEAVLEPGCSGEGVVRWRGPEETGREAAELGPAPFAFDVVVLLDGVRHVARATWPDDEIHGQAPFVDLTFSPPLPALA